MIGGTALPQSAPVHRVATRCGCLHAACQPPAIRSRPRSMTHLTLRFASPSLVSDHCWEPVGQHDNYRFALAAQPGGSQGRPTTNTNSRLIVSEWPSPLPHAPDGHTARRGNAGTGYVTPGTNAIENINSQLRKIIKTRGHFPTDEVATKLILLALRNITADWGVQFMTGRRR